MSRFYKNIIIAPHCDDELIGTFTLLWTEECSVVFVDKDSKRLEHAKKLEDYFDVSLHKYSDFDWNDVDLDFHNIFVPDPNYELHPLHKTIGFMGLQKYYEGYDIHFYTTNMNTPYVKLLSSKLSSKKKELLDLIYPDQKSLWLYEHKYFLYEGIVCYKNFHN